MPLQDLSWMEDARCVGAPLEMFFPDIGESSAKARRVCAKCPVKAECLQYGLGELTGIWGGTTDKERRVIRRNGAPPKKKGVAKCGTYSGHTAHRARGEKPCDACEEARRVYEREYRDRKRRGAAA